MTTEKDISWKLTPEEYKKICEVQHFTWFIRNNTGWTEDEYINNTSYQLDNLIPPQYYKQAVLSVNTEINHSHHDWQKAKDWIRGLVHEIYHRKD